MNPIPVLYHPTTLTLLDDDPEFLVTLSLALSSHQFKCRQFTAYQEAEQFLAQNNARPTLLKEYVQIDYQDLCRFSINVEIAKIHQEAWNPHRFARAAVLVVDYDMPSLNGLEIARYLKSYLPIKIILLTGEADQQTAINAFNNGEIDRFLLKSAPDCTKRLIQYIHQLQWEYFVALSAGALEPLIAQGSHPLQNKHFNSLFHQIMQTQRIVEFFLLDESGSFLMLDAQAQPTWLIVRNPTDMELFYDMANMEVDLPEAFLASLKNKEKIVFLPQPSAIVPPVKDWLLYDAIPLADQAIYYCIVKGWQNWPSEPLLSYSKFLHRY